MQYTNFSEMFINIQHQTINFTRCVFDIPTFWNNILLFLNRHLVQHFGIGLWQINPQRESFETKLKTMHGTSLKGKIPPTILLLRDARQMLPIGWPTRHKSKHGQLVMFCTHPCSFAEESQLLWGRLPYKEKIENQWSSNLRSRSCSWMIQDIETAYTCDYGDNGIFPRMFKKSQSILPSPCQLIKFSTRQND